MIEIVDARPDVNVADAEYARLLGYPRDWALKDRARELADWARAWYTAHGHPWVYARQADALDIAGGVVRIDGVAFSSARLHRTLREADAHAVVLVAGGAGPELEAAAQARWADEKPDEYFFLEVYGSAIVEHLVTMTGARLCAWAESQHVAVLPHYSPGYPDWSIDEQAALHALVERTRTRAMDAPLDVLESGMLRPKKSILAVFGITRHTERVAKLTDLVPCENCSYLTCQYRRAAYRRAPASTNPELAALASDAVAGEPRPDAPAAKPAASVLDTNATYTVNAKALRRWRDERLTIERREDGTVHACFRYDGTTCTNMGRPLQFHYRVTLGPREEGYPIRDEVCGPAPGDVGHTFMCRYLSNRERLMEAIEHEKPLIGRPLNDVLTWNRPVCAAGCYCEPDGRQHKWGLVLETLHYALAEQERIAASAEAAPKESHA